MNIQVAFWLILQHTQLENMALTHIVQDMLGQMSSHTAIPQKRLYFVSYNCMTARGLGRLDSIYNELKNAGVVALQGTRYPGNQLIETCQIGRFTHIASGYGKRTS